MENSREGKNDGKSFHDCKKEKKVLVSDSDKVKK